MNHNFKLYVMGYQKNLDPTEATTATMVFEKVNRTSHLIELQLQGIIMLAEVQVFGVRNTGLSAIDCWKHCYVMSYGTLI